MVTEEQAERALKIQEQKVALRKQETTPFAGYSREQKKELQKAGVTKAIAGAKLTKSTAALQQFQVAGQTVATAKTAATFIIPAAVLLGGLAALTVLWDFFTTGYNWLYLVGAVFVMIVIIRRMG